MVWHSMLLAVEVPVPVPEFQLTEQQELTQHLQHQTLLAHWEKMEPATQVMAAEVEPEAVDLLEVEVVMVDQETTAVLADTLV